MYIYFIIFQSTKIVGTNVKYNIKIKNLISVRIETALFFLANHFPWNIRSDFCTFYNEEHDRVIAYRYFLDVMGNVCF